MFVGLYLCLVRAVVWSKFPIIYVVLVMSIDFVHILAVRSKNLRSMKKENAVIAALPPMTKYSYTNNSN